MKLAIRRCFSEFDESSAFRDEEAEVERSTDEDEAIVFTFEGGTVEDSGMSLVSLRSEVNMRKVWLRQRGEAS